MQRWLTLAVLGGLGYWWWQRQQPVTTGAQVIQTGQQGIMYDKPIGPGLLGVTNVAKVHVTDTLDMPIGAFSRS